MMSRFDSTNSPPSSPQVNHFERMMNALFEQIGGDALRTTSPAEEGGLPDRINLGAIRRLANNRELFCPVRSGKPLAEMEVAVGAQAEIDFTYLAPCVGILLKSTGTPLVLGAHAVQVGDDTPPARIDEIIEQQLAQLLHAFPWTLTSITLITAPEGYGTEHSYYIRLRDRCGKLSPNVQVLEQSSGNLGILPDHDDDWLVSKLPRLPWKSSS